MNEMKITFHQMIYENVVHMTYDTYHGLVARAKKASQVKASGKASRL